MNDSSENIQVAIFLLLGFILLFLLLREFFCWYWKINKGVSLLNDIAKLQEIIVDIQTSANEKLDSVCEELTMLRQQQLEISIKQETMWRDE